MKRASIDRKVVKIFIKDNFPKLTPKYIIHEKEEKGVENECIENVRTKIKTHGGDIVFGWAIWE